MKNIPSLRIGNLSAAYPIIQGGMGVRVSKSNLAAAVANEGCIGVIASVGLGKFEDVHGSEFVKVNDVALIEEIRKAKKKTKGIVGVNIMVALGNYASLVEIAVEENIDLIISGAGLPLDLPKYTKGKDIKLVPIVSSARAFEIICKKWKNSYNKLPDAVIVEGVEAGGHLGYPLDQVLNHTAPKLEQIVTEVIKVANTFSPAIPVIAAGGIFDGNDIVKFLKLGAAGVQMATRFVCTDECDANIKFKEAYLKAGKDDIEIIKSPVGMPGRVIRNRFVEDVQNFIKVPFKCTYKCLRTCNPSTAPYCIARVLADAAEGKMDASFAFCGSNAYRCTEIISVKALVKKLADEIHAAE